MADYSALFEEAGAKHNIDPALLATVAKQESGMNAETRPSAQGALGLMQIMPRTAKKLGINPMVPAEAVDGAARLLSESLDRNNGDVEQAIGEYHGGPDRKLWGPKNAAYRKEVLAAYHGNAGNAAPPSDTSDADLLALASGTAPSGKPQASKPAASTDLSDDALLQIASGGGDGKAPAVDLTAAPAGALDSSKKPVSESLGFMEGLGRVAENTVRLDPLSAFDSQAKRAVDQQASQGMARFFAGREATQEPGKLGDLAGSVVGTLPTLALTRNPFVLGGLGGALTTKDPTNPKQVAQDVALGALGGKVADVGLNRIGGVIAPKFNAAVQKLIGEAVSMTPGQLMGGFAKDTEDKLSSAPILGDMIRNARGRGFRDFFDASLNRVLGPIQEKLPAGLEPREALQHTAQTVSHAYDDLLTGITVQADKTFSQGMGKAVQEARSMLPEARAKQVEGFLKDIVTSKIAKGGAMTGESMKAAEAKLSNLIRTYGSKPDGDQQLMADVLSGARDELRALVQRSNPQIAAPLKAVNTAFANLVRVEKAASSVGADHGMFTPAQLLNAVKSADSSVRKRAVAHGTALMQDLAEAGKSVLPNKIPDSGTVGRALMNLGVGGALGGGAILGHVAPAAAAGGALMMAPYTRIAGQLTNRLVQAQRGPAAQAARRGLEQLRLPAILAGGAAAAPKDQKRPSK